MPTHLFQPRNFYGFPQLQGRSSIFYRDPNFVIEENFLKKKTLFNYFYFSRVVDGLYNFWKK